MIRRPPRATRTDTLFPYTTLFRSGREDDAAKKLGELARAYDPSEIYATELEDTQLLCQTLQGCREAMECMRDHAAEMYRVETGKPFSPVRGSRVPRSEERRVGKEWGSMCRSWWSAYTVKKI